MSPTSSFGALWAEKWPPLGYMFQLTMFEWSRYEHRTRELRQRYLGLFLDGLRADGAEPLPGPPPAPEELATRWSPG